MTEKETKDPFEGEPWYRNPRYLRYIGWAAAVVTVVSIIWEVVYGGDVPLLSSLVGASMTLSVFLYHGIEGSRRELSGELQNLRRELVQETRLVGYEVRQVRDALGGELRSLGGELRSELRTSAGTIVAAIRETRPPS